MENLPAVQSVQLVAAVYAFVSRPASQSLQLNEPTACAALLYLPGLHAVQDVAPDAALV